MKRRSLLATALFLASLEAGCTSSEPIAPGDQTGGAAGITGSQEPFVPFSPVASAPLPATGGFAGSTGGSGSGGGAGGRGGATVSPSTPCGHPPMAPTPNGVMPGFRPNLGATVVAAKPPRPISGGTLLVLRDGSAAVASDPDRDHVTIVDLATRVIRAQIALSPGDEPGRLVEDGSGHVHVALRSGGAVATVDPVAGTLLARRDACAAPRGLAYQADGDLVHLACADGQLISMNAKTGTVLRSVQLDRDLRDVVSLADGRLIVSTFRRADALVLDSVGQITERLRPMSGPRKGMSGLQTMSPSVAWRLVGTPDGGAVMLHQRGVVDEVNPSAGGYGAGRGCGSIVEASVTVVAPGKKMGPSPGLANLAFAVDLALSPNGKDVAIAAPGNARTPMPQVTVTALFSATAPDIECMGPGSSMGGGSGENQVVAVAYTPGGTLITQSREPATLSLSDTSATISLSTQTVADTGHALFHVNAGGGIACASCHPEGGEDGRVWNFACLGARRTQSLRGGLAGTEPFHWDGDMNDFSKLVDEVFVGRMSGPPLAIDQRSAMLGWIDSIPLLPNPASQDPAVQRGKALFQDASVGCTTCHAGERLTNNTSVDVGTKLLAQVPSLRGVVWRAPFLHDGCAPTLLDRFGSCGGGDKHGKTSHLSAAEQSDLVAYLGTL